MLTKWFLFRPEWANAPQHRWDKVHGHVNGPVESSQSSNINCVKKWCKNRFESFINMAPEKKSFLECVQKIHTESGGVSRCGDWGACRKNFEHARRNLFLEELNCAMLEPTSIALECDGLSGIYRKFLAENTVYTKSCFTHFALEYAPFEKLSGKKLFRKYINVFWRGAFVHSNTLKSKIRTTARPVLLLDETIIRVILLD